MVFDLKAFEIDEVLVFLPLQIQFVRGSERSKTIVSTHVEHLSHALIHGVEDWLISLEQRIFEAGSIVSDLPEGRKLHLLVSSSIWQELPAQSHRDIVQWVKLISFRVSHHQKCLIFHLQAIIANRAKVMVHPWQKIPVCISGRGVAQYPSQPLLVNASQEPVKVVRVELERRLVGGVSGVSLRRLVALARASISTCFVLFTAFFCLDLDHFYRLTHVLESARRVSHQQGELLGEKSVQSLEQGHGSTEVKFRSLALDILLQIRDDRLKVCTLDLLAGKSAFKVAREPQLRELGNERVRSQIATD